MNSKYNIKQLFLIALSIPLFIIELSAQGRDKASILPDFPPTPIIYDSLTSIYSIKYEFRVIIDYSLKLLADPRVKTNDSYKATIYNSIGLNYWKLGELDSALNFLEKNIEIRERQKDSSALGRSYNNIGVLYWKKGNLERAYFNFSKALIFREKKGDLKGMVLVLNNLGLIYQRLKYYDNAFESISKALSIADSLEYKFGMGYSYRRLANLSLEKGDYDNFSNNADKAIKIYDELKAEDDMAEILNDYGRYYLLIKKYSTAKDYFSKSLSLAVKIKDKFVEANSLSYLGEASLSVNNLEEAFSFINKSLTLSVKKKYNVISRNNYYSLYKIYEKKGDKDNALICLKNYIQLKDSLMNEAIVSNINDEKIRQIVVQSEASKRLLIKENELNQQKIKEQERLNLFYILFILIASVAFIVIVVLYLRQRKLQKSILSTNEKLNKLNAELKNNNQLLEDSNNTKNKLFSIIAHDLKNPFMSIYGFAEMIFIKSQKSSENDLRAFSETLLESSKKLVQLIDNLTKWAQLHQSSLKPSQQEFNLSDELEVIIKQLKLNLELKKINLNLDVSSDTILYVDKDMISTVFRNLISNAIKFTPSGGSITIRSETINGSVNIFIKDTGVGISEEIIQRISVGKSINSTLGTSNEKGTGIGLSVCREFILLNKGTLFINSEINKGSEFRVTLPLK